MKIAKLMIGSATVLSAVLPLSTHAASSSLNGWGEAFAKAHAMSLNGAQLSGEGKAGAEFNVSSELSQAMSSKLANAADGGKDKVKEGADQAQAKATALVNRLADKADASYAQLGSKVDGLVSTVGDTVTALSKPLASGLSVEHSGDMNSALKLGQVASLNSGLMSSGAIQLSGVSQVAQLATLSTGLLQSVVAMRPATLTGLLR